MITAHGGHCDYCNMCWEAVPETIGAAIVWIKIIIMKLKSR